MLTLARCAAALFPCEGMSVAFLVAFATSNAPAQVYVLECHPLLPSIAMSASYDGTIIIWDLESGTPLQEC